MRSKSQIKYENIKNILLEKDLFSEEFILDDSLNYDKIQYDSSKIISGDIFVCIVGYKSDGHNYAKDAVERGAKLLIVQRKLPIPVNQIVVKDSRKSCAIISLLINDFPTKEMELVGITGTNGKTTTGFLIYNSLKILGKSVGFIGTLGYWINDDFHSLSRTTPDIIELHQIFVKMKNHKIKYVVMEVSSHSIFLSRIYGLHFSIGMITNLSREHLDFHKNMEEYSNTKFEFLNDTLNHNGKVVVNYDNEYIQKRTSEKMLKMSFDKGDFVINDANYDINQSKFYLKFFKERYKLKTNLVGKYNIQNVAFAFIALKLLNLGEKNSSIINALFKIKSIPGRLQQFKKSNIFVDFAHTPDALENVLLTLKKLTKKRLIVVVGAGGDRDKGKRPLMTEVCLNYADLTILTTDNPRTEKSENILREMFSKCSSNDNLYIQTNREVAIRSALTILEKDDILLIAGKGHEDYQEINGVKYHFNDLEMVEKYFENTYEIPENEPGCSTIKLQIPLDSLYLEFLFKSKINSSMNYFSISIDNRTISKNSIFFAIKGENFDAHKFVKNIGQGCLSIIDNENYSVENSLLVDNVLEKFQMLSSKYANLFSSRRIAITGSYGKTTTKEYLAQILSSKGKILKTYLNENNHIGVPKTLFRTNSKHLYSIVELGSNHPGEIAILAKIVNPEIGIITSVGASHIEYFGSIKNILNEKLSLLNYSNMKIISGDNDLLFESKQNAITVGKNERNDYHYKIVSQDFESTKIEIADNKYDIPTIVNSKIEDAALAIVCAIVEKYSQEEIQKKLNLELEIPQRMEIIKSNGRILIVDCYNANYDSMNSAINFWKSYKAELPHVAFLGDMLELGRESEKYHKKIGTSLLGINNKVYSIGKFSKAFNSIKHFSNVDELIEKMNFVSIPRNSVVLIKASHSIHLEKLIKRL